MQLPTDGLVVPPKDRMRLLSGKLTNAAPSSSSWPATWESSTPAIFSEPVEIAVLRFASVNTLNVSPQVVCPSGEIDVVVTLLGTPLTTTARVVLHPVVIPS